MRYALIENNTVVNVILANPDFDPGIPKVLLEESDVVGVGYTYDGTQFIKPPAPLPTLADYDAALTAHLDAVAQSRNWADRVSLMARAGFAGPWQADAVAFGTWADGCNVIGYQLLADYQAGTIPQPTIAEMLALLPEMVWPV